MNKIEKDELYKEANRIIDEIDSILLTVLFRCESN
jgi:hypothetical protein